MNPPLELLEPRRLLSASVENGVLLVVGTNLDDVIMVWEEMSGGGGVDYHVVVNTPLSQRPAEFHVIPDDGVRLVSVRALDGDDLVDVATSPLNPLAGPLHLPTRLDGGIGNDRIMGGVARSFISGGFGDDRIDGGRADDWINGGWGNDFISGNEGNDVIFGDRDNDRLWGMLGNDRLYGGAGDDELGYYDKVGPPEAHEPGNDLLDGGTGDDRLVGGAGTDRMYGGPGVDRFFYLDTRAEMIDWTPGEPTDYRPPIR